MPVLSSLDAGIIGLPTGLKEAGKRVDFKPDDFALVIETKGYRIAWSRAAPCPCTPNNDQTDQPDPTCTLCKGQGWILFAPAGSVIDELKVGELTDVQMRIVNEGAGVVSAIMSNFVNTPEPWDYVSSRIEGTVQVTTRAENKLGYYDRIVNLDSLIVYSQILETDGTNELETKYPVVDINLLRSESTVYDSSYYTLESGTITWVAGMEPAKGVRVVVHYLMHPVWRIVEHPHALRLSPVKFKTAKPVTPRGDPRPLPVQGIAKYEWLP